jgi:NADPH:quinone reductase-like Zn-dependent oxidoreductase
VLHTESTRGERRTVAQVADAHGEIEFLLQHFDDAIAECYFQIESRMPSHECRKNRRDAMPTEQQRDLSFAEASTIPCAGVAAWNALLADDDLAAGDEVVLLGTGGVSIWGLQLARAAGLRTIITSSDDAKLERARQLGADATINYSKTADWDREVIRLTNERGVHRFVEVGGARTLRRSIAATRIGGTVAIVGSVGGSMGDFDPFDLIDGAKRMRGVLVGSRAMTADLVDFMERNTVRPVIDRVFGFEDVRGAYEYLQSGRHFGKVVVTIH